MVIAVGIFYALLRSFMSSFPGILSLSRRVLWIILSLAVGGALILVLVQVPMDRGIDTQHSDRGSAAPQKEPGVAHAAPRPAARENQVARLVLLDFYHRSDRNHGSAFHACIHAGLLSVVPDRLARNTAVFAAGYVVFFAVKSLTSFSLLTFPRMRSPEIGILTLVVSAACYLYWLFFSNSGSARRSEITLGHRWKPQEQERLLGQLGAINATILRSTRSPKLN